MLLTPWGFCASKFGLEKHMLYLLFLQHFLRKLLYTYPTQYLISSAIILRALLNVLFHILPASRLIMLIFAFIALNQPAIGSLETTDV